MPLTPVNVDCRQHWHFHQTPVLPTLALPSDTVPPTLALPLDTVPPTLALPSDTVSTCGGGFFLVCEGFGRMFDHLFPACAFFFFKVEISSRTLIPLFMLESVHSGSAG